MNDYPAWKRVISSLTEVSLESLAGAHPSPLRISSYGYRKHPWRVSSVQEAKEILMTEELWPESTTERQFWSAFNKEYQNEFDMISDLVRWASMGTKKILACERLTEEIRRKPFSCIQWCNVKYNRGNHAADFIESHAAPAQRFDDYNIIVYPKWDSVILGNVSDQMLIVNP